MVYPPKTQRSKLMGSCLGSITLATPSCRLVTFAPLLFDISEFSLDLLDRRLVSRVLARVVTKRQILVNAILMEAV